MRVLTQKEQISKTYDYIVSVTKFQNKLLRKDILWGDGSIHGFNKEIFNVTYDAIKETLKDILN